MQEILTEMITTKATQLFFPATTLIEILVTGKSAGKISLASVGERNFI